MSLQNNFTPKCACNKPMALVKGSALGRRAQRDDSFYICTRCCQEIRCFTGTLKPMGKPADPTLRGEREWVQARMDALIRAKATKDNVSIEEATRAAWKWMSKICKREIERVEEMGIPDMDHAVPTLRKL